MREIIYYVASSLDGYISGPDDDVSLFIGEGNGVTQYLNDLQAFDTVIMGRKTYEFGYKFGLEPGQPAYPHMEHYIVSDTLSFENPHEKVHIVSLDLPFIQSLKDQEGAPIYLCGGGELAAWCLEHDLIDTLKIKLNPILLGEGVPLFGTSQKSWKGKLLSTDAYEGGLLINTYKM